MDQPYVYEALARAFYAEGVTRLFTLLGDANLHFGTSLGAMQGVHTFHVRHEHCACMMAIGYAQATGKVGVASVTAGPGLTQTLTALATAVAARTPVVVMAGETPLGSGWSNQGVNQDAMISSIGARYIAAHSPARMLDYVSEAFYVAQFERKPVVLGVPYDLQKKPLVKAEHYTPSHHYIPQIGRTPPDPDAVSAAVEKIWSAKRPILVAGRGAIQSGAVPQCLELAELCGGLLATTLPARGLFDANPFSVGLAGGFSDARARTMFSECDLIIAIGSSLTHFTVDGGSLFPQAQVIQIDEEPLGRRHGLKAADLYVKSDAKIGLEAIILGLLAKPHMTGWRSETLAQRLAAHRGYDEQFELATGTLDPRRAIAALDDVVPKDWEIVGGAGHCSYFYSHMRGRDPRHFHVCREFGAIGNSLAYAMGVAAAKPDANIVLIEGDGSFLMHVQELETIRRHNLRILICVLNDGGFGAEFHKLRADGIDDRGVIFGYGDLAAIARGFSLRGEVIDLEAQFGPNLQAFRSADRAEVWDIRISDRVPTPKMRNAQLKRERGG